ncbi:hypothetical protein JHK85_001707 [Glycine max]|nr:hypothetical protein JHK85_001707 [Glycine max]KAG5089055.1 hypothetical protein JHK86_001667 [Glycine max]
MEHPPSPSITLVNPKLGYDLVPAVLLMVRPSLWKANFQNHCWRTTNAIYGTVGLRPTFYRIYKKKCTDGFHSLPYLLSLMSSMLWLYYAFLKIHDGVVPLITINSIGCVIELIYILTNIKYAHKDARIPNVGGFALGLV